MGHFWPLACAFCSIIQVFLLYLDAPGIEMGFPPGAIYPAGVTKLSIGTHVLWTSLYKKI